MKIALKIFTSRTKNFQFNNKSALIILLLICGLGSFRIILINNSFWLDELTTSWVVGGNFQDIFKRCWINNLSPVFYMVVYLSKVLFGYSEFSLRLPSFIVGILTIPMIYLFTYKLTRDIKLSLLAAFFSSIDYTMVHFSLEVRPYALVIFLSLVHLYLFLDFLRSRRKTTYAIILGVLSGLIILLHYTAASILIVEFIIAIIYFHREKEFSKPTIFSLLLSFLIPCIIFIPFLGHIIYLVANNSILGSFIQERNILEVFSLHPHFMTFILFPALICFFIAFASKTKIWDPKYKDNGFILFFLLSWYFVPQFVHWFISEIDIATIFHPRYLIWIIPAPIIGSAILIRHLPSNWMKSVFIISILLLSAYVYIPYFNNILVNTFGSNNSQNNLPVENDLTRSQNAFSWKEAVNLLNNSNIEVNRIYVVAPLVESLMLNKSINDSQLLNNYLLSTVNSMYKLKQEYLDISVPIHSVKEISDTMSNFLVVSQIEKISSEDIYKYIPNGVELSPENPDWVIIYYVE